MTPRSTWSHETELAAEHVSASRAREFLALHLEEHHLSHLQDDMRLVVSELATNAMLHARTPFTVYLSGDDTSVLLTVVDGSASVLVHVTADDLDDGGRGLSIVDALSHGWGVSDGYGGGKSVWASFLTGPDPGQPS
ncbi:MAG: ATP-binding protein [Nocardioidaceae bacterium]